MRSLAASGDKLALMCLLSVVCVRCVKPNTQRQRSCVSVCVFIRLKLYAVGLDEALVASTALDVDNYIHRVLDEQKLHTQTHTRFASMAEKDRAQST